MWRPFCSGRWSPRCSTAEVRWLALLAKLLAVAWLFVPSAGAATDATPPLGVLLSRHVPILVLHPAEQLQPVPVEGFLADSDLFRQAGQGWENVRGPLPSGGADLRLDQTLCRAREGVGATSCYVSAQAAHPFGPVVYGAALRFATQRRRAAWVGEGEAARAPAACLRRARIARELLRAGSTPTRSPFRGPGPDLGHRGIRRPTGRLRGERARRSSPARAGDGRETELDGVRRQLGRGRIRALSRQRADRRRRWPARPSVPRAVAAACCRGVVLVPGIGDHERTESVAAAQRTPSGILRGRNSR